MKKELHFILVLLVAFLVSCSGVNKIAKSPDFDFKYEAAKQYYEKGKYANASFLITEAMPALKGTEKGHEATFLLAMSKYFLGEYSTASEYLKKYYTSYPVGEHVDEARFYAAKALYMETPLVQLDQTNTYQAITELQNFIELAPESKYAPKARQLIFQLQDKLVEKEYLSAKLYFNLGGYFGNCTMGGNNYEACIKTAENAIRDYPYSSLKEDFSYLILRSKYELAVSSVQEKMKERYENTIDEYYGFVNEYPNSKYLKTAKSIYEKSKSASKVLQNTKPADETITPLNTNN